MMQARPALFRQPYDGTNETMQRSSTADATGSARHDPDRAPITLVSTCTIDHLPLADGRVLDIPGGPAMYIAGAFRRLGRPFALITGDRADVQVIPGDGGQEYLIPSLPSIVLPPRLTGPATIISPIIGEVPADAVPPVDGLLVIDLQGFVREPDVPTGQRSRAFDLSALLRRTHVVKASAAELERLTPRSAAALASVLLLDTHGADGIVLHERGTRYHIPAPPVRATHTIGAGDTLLAGFVDALLNGLMPATAARQAVDFTEAVLRERPPS